MMSGIVRQSSTDPAVESHCRAPALPVNQLAAVSNDPETAAAKPPAKPTIAPANCARANPRLRSG